MRILFLTPYLPSPPRTGGQRRAQALLHGLSRRHEVRLLAFVGGGDDVAERVRATRAACARVVTVPDPALARPRRRLSQLASLATGRSFEARRFGGRRVRRAAAEFLAEGVDLVHVESAELTAALPPTDVPVVIDEQNIEYEVLARTAETAAGLGRRVYNRLDARKLRLEEQRAWRSVAAVTLPSDRDAEVVRRAAPRTRVTVVPNGVDTETFRPRGERELVETVLFFGTLGYHPNRDGMSWFAERVLPLLRRTHPAVRVVAVGPATKDESEPLVARGVTAIGAVEDVRPFIEGATAVVVPLRIGGGTRLKILEAMALARPVVSTTVGAEGIDHEDALLIADDPAAMAGAIGRLFDDATLRRRLGQAGRALVVRRYDWSRSIASLESLYADIRDGREQAAAIPVEGRV